MSDAEFFLDTNILVYTFDRTAPDKQAKAQALLEQAFENHTGTVVYGLPGHPALPKSFRHPATLAFQLL